MFKIKIQGHLTSSILVPIDSACIYHFLLFIYSNWRYLLPFSRYWRILLEDSFFPHFTRCLTPLSGEMPCNINATYTPLKVHLVGYNSVADFIRVYLHSFSYCCLRNLWNFEKIWTYSSLTNTDQWPAAQFVDIAAYYIVFEILTLKASKWCFPNAPCLTPRCVWISGWNLPRKN